MFVVKPFHCCFAGPTLIMPIFPEWGIHTNLAYLWGFRNHFLTLHSGAFFLNTLGNSGVRPKPFPPLFFFPMSLFQELLFPHSLLPLPFWTRPWVSYFIIVTVGCRKQECSHASLSWQKVVGLSGMQGTNSAVCCVLVGAPSLCCVSGIGQLTGRPSPVAWGRKRVSAFPAWLGVRMGSSSPDLHFHF